MTNILLHHVWPISAGAVNTRFDAKHVHYLEPLSCLFTLGAGISVAMSLFLPQAL